MFPSVGGGGGGGDRGNQNGRRLGLGAKIGNIEFVKSAVVISLKIKLTSFVFDIHIHMI